MRDMTVGELRAALAEFPDYYAVAPFIEGEIGVATAVRAVKGPDAGEPIVLVGECDLPLDLIEATRRTSNRPGQSE